MVGGRDVYDAREPLPPPMVSEAKERTEVSSGWAGDAAELSARWQQPPLNQRF